MSEVKIKAESRTEFGKGAARRIRRAGLVPAVLYGHGGAPVHITLPGHELMLALKTANALFDVDLGERSELAIPKQVQRDPIKGFLEHVDLLIVRRGEKVVVEVPVTLTGEAGPGSLVSTEHTTLSVEAEATHIPAGIEVSIEGLEVGTQILAKDISLPRGTTLHLEPETLVVNITAAPTAEQVESELAEAEAEIEGGEGAAEGAEAAEPEATEEGAGEESGEQE
ncbi:large subunit ribosomal protein L25 [Actinopolymorpha cephalotaxi]|uniref:Large ribosomal subunit protein bL25 n=1 Tax=Actinopolymorpha cephalotaxi TaxID=504797 RepID=A0A1I2M4D8_9ACTN|nr:50S ribosomal protein L25/general stress protein Ctc [Actinopolymorpha cephalotaxi]NYH81581.1 large subunit ribosomal protein L25 [Actinopolymorpha cephalotaxi]SFF86333.1 large subunit ribosomal protein L25 [Actinopolymorpha cephalotaxi]